MKLFKVISRSLVGLGLLATQAAFADSISPNSYSATLGLGESVTITKTVTVDEITTGVLDVMFLIDTSGSMGSEIDAAKAAAGDILTGLSGFGNVATGVGYYSEPGSEGVYHDLTTDTATGQADINSIYLNQGGNGGDFPEEGINAVYQAASDASWRPGSSRFIIALGDATFKESDGVTQAMAQAALDGNDVTFIGIDYGYMTMSSYGGIDPTLFADATGGSIIASSGLSTADLVADILAGLTAAFEEYSEVTVSDLLGGMPGVSVTVACVSADGAACSGDTATGSYDRSESRDFVFDVTFTGLEEGTHVFDTYGLVDGGIVATENDIITVAAVPEPGTVFLLGAGLVGMFASRRKRA